MKGWAEDPPMFNVLSISRNFGDFFCAAVGAGSLYTDEGGIWHRKAHYWFTVARQI